MQVQNCSRLLVISILAVFALFQGAVVTSTLFAEVSPNTFTLDNGLKVLVKSLPGTPVVAVQIWVKVGSRNEQPGEEGFCHLVEHMLFKGSAKFPKGSMDSAITQLGATHNALTSHDYTCYFLTGAKQHFRKLMELESDAVLASLFEPEDFSREKEVVLEELRANLDNPRQNLYQITQETVFQKHPYRHPIIGYEHSVASATRDQVYEFYKRHYVAGNIWVVIVGDIDSEEAVAVVKETMGGAAKIELPATQIQPEPVQTRRRETVRFADVQQARINMAWPAAGVADYDNIVLDVIARIVGGGRSSRLQQILVEREKLAHTVEVQYYTAYDPFMFLIHATVDQGKTRNFVARVSDIVKELTVEEVPEEELQRAKQQIIAQTIFADETAAAQAFRYGHYATLASVEDADTYISKIRGVSRQDVQRVAAVTFADASLSVCSLRPVVTQTADKPEKITLENGLRLILKENHSAPIVALAMQIDAGGLREVGGREAGLANLVANTLLKGTSQRTADEIAQIFDDMGTTVTCSATKSSVTIKMKCLSEHLMPSLDMLLHILGNAEFPVSAIRREKEAAIQALKTLSDDMFQFAYFQALEKIYAGTPMAYPNQGIEAALTRIDANDVRRFFKENYHSGGMVVSLVGDFYGNEIRRTLENKFAFIRTHKGKKSDELKVSDITGQIQVTNQKNRLQSQIVVARRTFSRSDPQMPALDIVCNILSGSPSARLFVNLRSKDALAYSVWAGSVGFLNDGLFYAAMSTQAGKTAEAQTRLLEEIENVRLRGFSETELSAAKEFIVGQYALKLVDNLAMAETFATDEYFGLGHDYYLNYPSLIASLSADEVANVAMKYLVASEGFVISVTRP